MSDKAKKRVKWWCINIAVLAALSCGSLAIGCIRKIQVIDNNNVVTNTVSTTAFQDENYVWENWFFGTNKADNAIQK